MSGPMPDPATPAPGPLFVFGSEFDVRACAVREGRNLVRKLEQDLQQARAELMENEALLQALLNRAIN